MSDLDINALIAQGSVRVTLGEHGDERNARLIREEREHTSNLYKGWVIFGLLIASYLGLLGLCVYVLVSNGPSSSTMASQLAWHGVTILFTGLVSGFAGLMIGTHKK